jgi:hypothetical protein
MLDPSPISSYSTPHIGPITSELSYRTRHIRSIISDSSNPALGAAVLRGCTRQLRRRCHRRQLHGVGRPKLSVVMAAVGSEAATVLRKVRKKDSAFCEEGRTGATEVVETPPWVCTTPALIRMTMVPVVRPSRSLPSRQRKQPRRHHPPGSFLQ